MKSNVLASLFTGGGKDKDVEVRSGSTVNKTALDDLADSRDIISMFVGGGYTSLSDKDAKNAFDRLSNVVGSKLAQKLATQAFLYNQRSESKKLQPEQRVQNFFSLGSNDTEVSDYMKKSGNMGTGPVDAFRNSQLLANSNMQGKYVSGNTSQEDAMKLLQKVPLPNIVMSKMK